MIPLALLPGSAHWGAHLDELLARPEVLWVHGAPGSGISALAAELAARRGGAGIRLLRWQLRRTRVARGVALRPQHPEPSAVAA